MNVISHPVAKVRNLVYSRCHIFLNYAFLIAHKYDMDIKEIILNKLKRNGEKYPVNKAKGSAKKYNEL